jgi:hypothetical protein
MYELCISTRVIILRDHELMFAFGFINVYVSPFTLEERRDPGPGPKREDGGVAGDCQAGDHVNMCMIFIGGPNNSFSENHGKEWPAVKAVDKSTRLEAGLGRFNILCSCGAYFSRSGDYQ